jgi:ubiquinone/menaquinone biosynthesis C-methylase UbiE
MRNNNKELSKAGLDKDAAEYDRSPKYASLRLVYNKIAEEVLHCDFHAWLDVGCGTGTLLSMIGKQRKEAQLFGIDLSEEMIRVARRKLGDSVQLRASDSEKLPFQNEQFDLITCTFSFHHYPNPKAVLMEMRRVLTPNGKLIVADPSAFTPVRQIVNLLAPFRKNGTVRFYSKNEMSRLAQSAAFAVSKWSKLNWHSYIMVAEKETR